MGGGEGEDGPDETESTWRDRKSVSTARMNWETMGHTHSDWLQVNISSGDLERRGRKESQDDSGRREPRHGQG